MSGTPGTVSPELGPFQRQWAPLCPEWRGSRRPGRGGRRGPENRAARSGRGIARRLAALSSQSRVAGVGAQVRSLCLSNRRGEGRSRKREARAFALTMPGGNDSSRGGLRAPRRRHLGPAAALRSFPGEKLGAPKSGSGLPCPAELPRPRSLNSPLRCCPLTLSRGEALAAPGSATCALWVSRGGRGRGTGGSPARQPLALGRSLLAPGRG